MTEGPIKVLTAVWQTGVGDAVAEQIEAFRHFDRDAVHVDFLISSQFEGRYDAVIRECGGRVVMGKDSSRGRRNLRELAAINDQFGPYDVVHSHRYAHYRGVALLDAAERLHIPVRIAHTHFIPPFEDGGLSRMFSRIKPSIARRSYTHGLANTQAAALDFFGPGWERDPRVRVLPPACDYDRTPSAEGKPDERAARRSEFLLACVSDYTNLLDLAFTLSVADELRKSSANFRLALIGDGPLQPLIRQQVRFAGLSEHVVFVDVDDMADVLQQADAMLVPASHALLSNSVLQAQAAGVTCFLSDLVCDEASVVESLVHRFQQQDGPEECATTIERFASNKQISAADRQRARRLCRESGRDVRDYARQLHGIYAQCHARGQQTVVNRESLVP